MMRPRLRRDARLSGVGLERAIDDHGLATLLIRSTSGWGAEYIFCTISATSFPDFGFSSTLARLASSSRPGSFNAASKPARSAVNCGAGVVGVARNVR